MPSTVTKQSSISPVGGVSTSAQVGRSNSSLINSPSDGPHKSSAMTYDTSANKTSVATTGGNNGKKGIFSLH
jgi:hypothetical protein